MARNAEKAQSMLYRFREAKAAELAGEKGAVSASFTRKASSIHPNALDTLPKAERVRGELINDISSKIGRMQDPSLSDAQLRELNDTINKLMDRKYGVEKRIMALGGPDLRRNNRNFLIEGKEVPGIRGYRYYGRAQQLPGIAELFQREAPKVTPKTRYELVRNVDAEYYGFRDEEDGSLLAYEERITAYKVIEVADPDVPSQAQVGAWLLEKKKEELISQYT